jgi:hypothetical protein
LKLAFKFIYTQFCRERALDLSRPTADGEFLDHHTRAWDRRNPAPKWPGAVVIVHRGVIFEPLWRRAGSGIGRSRRET